MILGTISSCLLRKPTISLFSKNGSASFLLKFNNLSTSNIANVSSKTTKGHLLKPRYKRYLKVIGIGFGAGGIASGLYLYDMYKKVNKGPVTGTLNSPSDEYLLQEPPPKHQIARSVPSFGNDIALKITLYQFQTCPFCCKVRTFLDYYGLAYDVVEVNSVTHKQTKWTTYRKVPFVVIEQEGVEKCLQLKDSSMIISALQSWILNKHQSLEEIVKGYPTISSVNEDGVKRTDIMNRYSIMLGELPIGKTKEEIVLERKWRKWVDDVYVHMLSPNVYRTLNESFQAFSWFSEVGNWKELFETWERLLVVYVGAFAMYFIGKRLKKRYYLKDDVRISFYDETNFFLKELKSGEKTFLGGEEPNLSDLSIYGVLTAVEGCDAFADLVNNTQINSWFMRMKKAVETHQGAKYVEDKR